MNNERESTHEEAEKSLRAPLESELRGFVAMGRDEGGVFFEWQRHAIPAGSRSPHGADRVCLRIYEWKI